MAFFTLVAMARVNLNAIETKGRFGQEYDLKAAFLFNFAHFVDWPTEAHSEIEPIFVIGVLGEDPFGKSLDKIVANEEIRNRKIVIRRYHNVQEIGNCQILYISKSETPRLNHILKFLEQKSILTVGEVDRYPAPDTIICFFVAQNKLRLKINVGAARAAGLTISSKLLRQAEIADARREP